MIIALEGFMGSGKSSVGRVLADMLGIRFIDLDETIVEGENRPIPEIFSSEGEKGFRILELNYLRRFLKGGGEAVLSLGGGTPTISAAASLIREKTICIYLRASLDTLEANLSGSESSRPLLEGAPLREKIASLLSERAETYEECAHATIDIDGLSPEEIAEEIIIGCL